MTAERQYAPDPTLDDMSIDPSYDQPIADAPTDARIIPFPTYQEMQRRQAERASDAIRAIGESAAAGTAMFPDLAIKDEQRVLARTGQPYTGGVRPQPENYQPDDKDVVAIAERILNQADAADAKAGPRISIGHDPDNIHYSIPPGSAFETSESQPPVTIKRGNYTADHADYTISTQPEQDAEG